MFGIVSTPFLSLYFFTLPKTVVKVSPGFGVGLADDIFGSVFLNNLWVFMAITRYWPAVLRRIGFHNKPSHHNNLITLIRLPN